MNQQEYEDQQSELLEAIDTAQNRLDLARLHRDPPVVLRNRAQALGRAQQAYDEFMDRDWEGMQ